ncbi:MAG: tyrosine-protein phosphatase [Chloroflexota bacterium]
MLIDHSTRRLAWDACYNVRDIGGYATGDGGLTRYRAIVRADNLCNLSPEGQAALVEYGVRTVVDLRGPWETPSESSPFARPNRYRDVVSYLNLPLIDAEELGEAAFEKAGSVVDSYRIMLDTYHGPIAAIMTAIARAPEGTVLVHCHAGKDRTGIVSAMLLDLVGVSRDTIADDYSLSDSYLKPLYQQWLENVEDDADPQSVERLRHSVLCAPDTMLGTLAHIDERYGGVADYLLTADVDPQDLERLRQRLVR